MSEPEHPGANVPVTRYWYCVEIDGNVHPFETEAEAREFYAQVQHGFCGGDVQREHEVTLYVRNLEVAKKWVNG